MNGPEVLEKILSGNRRFPDGKRMGPCNPVDMDLTGLFQNQTPVAAVFCCSGSRVPPEHVLDMKGVARLKPPLKVMEEDLKVPWVN